MALLILPDEKIFAAVEAHEKYELDFNWKEVFEEIREPKVDKDYKIEFGKFDFDKVMEIMVGHEFSKERIEKQFEKIHQAESDSKQKTLF